MTLLLEAGRSRHTRDRTTPWRTRARAAELWDDAVRDSLPGDITTIDGEGQPRLVFELVVRTVW